MPADLLLPAFALTLVVNAVIVAVAIRALRQGSAAPTATPAATPVDRPRRPRPTGPAEPVGSVPIPAADPRPAPEPEEAPATEGPAAAVALTPAGRRPRPKPVATKDQAVKGGSGRRRKFSLPPLDEDHEKVSRSIETFLGVGDELAGAPSPPVAPAAADAPAPVAVVTVAVIQLEGSGSSDLLERTVRSAARAADQVSVDRRGRVRVVLSGTGEVAAKAYLRRIRAIVEPIAEAADSRSHIVMATATELDGAIGTARRRADRRLAVALRHQPVATSADDDVREPRAAGD